MLLPSRSALRKNEEKLPLESPSTDIMRWPAVPPANPGILGNTARRLGSAFRSLSAQYRRRALGVGWASWRTERDARTGLCKRDGASTTCGEQMGSGSLGCIIWAARAHTATAVVSHLVYSSLHRQSVRHDVSGMRAEPKNGNVTGRMFK